MGGHDPKKVEYHWTKRCIKSFTPVLLQDKSPLKHTQGKQNKDTVVSHPQSHLNFR
jgi:hypothetical protein